MDDLIHSLSDVHMIMVHPYLMQLFLTNLNIFQLVHVNFD